MRYTEPIESWVVYEKQSQGRTKRTFVCDRAEWDAMVLADPTEFILIQAEIVNEGEAERLARSGAVLVRVKAPISRTPAIKPPVKKVSGHSQTRQAGAMRNWWSQSRRLNAVPESSDNASSVSA